MPRNWPRPATRICARAVADRGGANPESGLAVADSLLAAGNAAEIADAWVAMGSPFDLATLTQLIDQRFAMPSAVWCRSQDLPDLFARSSARASASASPAATALPPWRIRFAHFGLSPMVDFIAGYDNGFGYKPGGRHAARFLQRVQPRPG